jgi:hypothetical protein
MRETRRKCTRRNRLTPQEAEEKLMRKWVDEDHPEVTEEQKANLTKLFREV